MFFQDWDNLLRILILGTLAYIGLVILLRASGNRTLSKMNSFDFVITVAFGSILSTIFLNKAIPLADGLVAIAVLILLQFTITWLSVRFKTIDSMVKTEPTLLLKDGRMLKDAMTRVRITEDEIFAAVRKKGIGGIEQVAVVVLESDGSLSVIETKNEGSLSALQHVHK